MKFFNPTRQAILALLIIFLLDLLAPLGVAVGVLYLLCFLLVCTQNKKVIVIFAVITSILTIAKFIVFLSPEINYTIYANRGISITVIWIVAALAIRHQKLSEIINSERRFHINDLEKTILAISNYKMLFEQIPLAILLFEYDKLKNNFLCRDINTTACKIQNVTKAEIVNSEITAFYPNSRNTGLLDLLQKVYETGETIITPPRHFYHDQMEGWRELYIFKLNNSEVVLVFKDVTEKAIADKLLEKALADKKTLLNEVHHRVKNNLQIIIGLMQMQSATFKAVPFVNEFLLQSENRIKAMGLIHETIYQTGQYSGINIVSYIRSLFAYLCNAIGKPQIEFKIESEINEIAISDASAFGIVLNEIITNSLKYAFPENSNGEIFVSIKQENDEAILINIKDNGIGVEAISNNSKGLGVELIFGLIKQLKGTVKMETYPSFNYSIKLPIFKKVQN